MVSFFTTVIDDAHLTGLTHWPLLSEPYNPSIGVVRGDTVRIDYTGTPLGDGPGHGSSGRVVEIGRHTRAGEVFLKVVCATTEHIIPAAYCYKELDNESA